LRTGEEEGKRKGGTREKSRRGREEEGDGRITGEKTVAGAKATKKEAAENKKNGGQVSKTRERESRGQEQGERTKKTKKKKTIRERKRRD